MDSFGATDQNLLLFSKGFIIIDSTSTMSNQNKDFMAQINDYYTIQVQRTK